MRVGFPAGPVVKNPPPSAGDLGLIPRSGRSPGGGNGNPLQYACLENPMDRGAWWAVVHGVSKSWDRTEWLTLSLSWVFQLLKAPTKWKKVISWWSWSCCPQTYWHLRIDDVKDDALQADSLPAEPPGKPQETCMRYYYLAISERSYQTEFGERACSREGLTGPAWLCVHFQKCGLQLSWVFLSYSVMNMWFIKIHIYVYIYTHTHTHKANSYISSPFLSLYHVRCFYFMS